MNICAGAALLTYALYTKADDTIARVGSHWMLATIPFVVYGVFRYLFLIHRRQAGGDPVHILFHDRPTLLNLLLWITAAGLVIYLPRFIQLSRCRGSTFSSWCFLSRPRGCDLRTFFGR